MKTLIVTASSKTKNKKGEIAFKKINNTFLDSIDQNFQKELLKSRSILLNDFKFSQGPDTHPDIKAKNALSYLPAYSRYTGRTYSKISNEAWKNVLSNPEKFDCIILSAKYGLIRFDECIRNYEIKQVTKMSDGKTIGKFWKEQGASDWLYDYIKNNDINDVKFVLSTSYSDIVKKEDLIVRLKEDLDIKAEDKQFKAGGMKSMLLRGQYINDLLLEQL